MTSEDRTKKVSSAWETDHLRQMKQHLLPEERRNQMQHILFWFHNFEISSLTQKELVLFTVDFSPSCGWNNWSLEEWTSATELFKLFVLIVHFESLFSTLKKTFWILSVFLTLFNNVHCLKKKNKLNSNLGGFSAAVNCTFCTNSGCCASCKIAPCASVCYLCRLI